MQWSERVRTWVMPQPAGPGNAPLPQVESGMYHYQRSRDDAYIRFHLRVERNGEALLIAGASEAVRLSRVGTSVIKRLLDGTSPEALCGELQLASGDQLVAEVVEMINELGSPSSRFPMFNLSDPGDDRRDAELLAPFQADVEIKELTHLRSILQKLWEAGIPHARFLPAVSLPDDHLVQAVEWAEDLGMIAGVRATANWLGQADRIACLAAVGTDYLICPWAVDADLHARWFGADDLDGMDTVIGRVQEFEMTSVLEIPLVSTSVEALDDHLTQLIKWNVTHAEVYALAAALADGSAGQADDTPRAAEDVALEGSLLRAIAALIEETADENAFHLTWLPPLAVKPVESVAEHARRGPRAGGDVTIRVLANGDVLPPRGGIQPAGNLLADSWHDIWSGSVCRQFRQRVEADTRCLECPGLAICAAACPMDPSGWSHDDFSNERLP